MPRRRPALKPGDVCRVSKKHSRYANRDATYTVIKVLDGDGSDRYSRIQVAESIPSRFGKGGFRKPVKRNVRRDYLWFTGYNTHTGEKKKNSRKPVSRDFRITPTAFNANRGPHLCHCSDETFARSGCVCNGL